MVSYNVMTADGEGAAGSDRYNQRHVAASGMLTENRGATTRGTKTTDKPLGGRDSICNMISAAILTVLKD